MAPFFFVLVMHTNDNLISFLSSFITEKRLQRMDEILNKRTRYITVALEDVFQSHNISAVCRSCDCFGIHDIHMIENKNPFVVNSQIEVGSTRWLQIHRYNQGENNTPDCIGYLKSKGYRIVATTPNREAISLDQFDLGKGPVALFFGTELDGLTGEVFNACDEFLNIPLYGFTESLNISVSAAIILHFLYNSLVHSEINWQLSEGEKQSIKLEWLRNTVKKSELLEEQFYKNEKNMKPR